MLFINQTLILSSYQWLFFLQVFEWLAMNRLIKADQELSSTEIIDYQYDLEHELEQSDDHKYKSFIESERFALKSMMILMGLYQTYIILFCITYGTISWEKNRTIVYKIQICLIVPIWVSLYRRMKKNFNEQFKKTKRTM